MQEGDEEMKGFYDHTFASMMDEIHELPSGIFGQYAKNSLLVLIQLAANGIMDFNGTLLEHLNDSDTLFSTYEGDFQTIRELGQAVNEKEKERAVLHHAFLQKKMEYERLLEDYQQEKGLGRLREGLGKKDVASSNE